MLATLREKWSDLPAGNRRLVLVALVAYIAVMSLVMWSFMSGHVSVGLGVLVGVFILPEFIVVPLRIRRANRAASAARARRAERRSAE